jgi:hypothetical protein
VGKDPDERRALAQNNRDAVAAVRRAGGEAALLGPRDPLHAKLAVIDDDVAFLDDRNWSDAGPQTILRDDDPADVALVRSALARRPASNARLEMVKPRSLRQECDVIADAASDALDVETESFGIGPVYDALVARAARGAPTRLLVAARELAEARARADLPDARRPNELAALDRLRAEGVDVRITDASEKLAIGPHSAWVGSSNATRDWGSTAAQIDWGMRVPADLVEPLRARFAQLWDGAQPYGMGDREAAA